MKSLLASIAVLAIAIGIGFAVLAMQSRSGKAPGLVDGQLKPCGEKPNCVSSMAHGKNGHHIEGFKFEPGDADSIWTDLTNVVVELGGELTDNAPPYLSATFSSQIFGFVDDFECLISNESGTVHVRSASRVGYSDLDANRKRVEAIRARLAASR